ncbi:hypothetical protein [Caulobacter sp. 17J80-11]|nr:hypothetical protein [Caulobacter sp. 17J80-11]MBC6981568.1 hypothetical protein [Caulobacter sp. 17J80-11]
MVRVAGGVFVLLALAWALGLAAGSRDQRTVKRVDAGVGAHVATAVG